MFVGYANVSGYALVQLSINNHGEANLKVIKITIALVPFPRYSLVPFRQLIEVLMLPASFTPVVCTSKQMPLNLRQCSAANSAV